MTDDVLRRLGSQSQTTDKFGRTPEEIIRQTSNKFSRELQAIMRPVHARQERQRMADIKDAFEAGFAAAKSGDKYCGPAWLTHKTTYRKPTP